MPKATNIQCREEEKPVENCVKKFLPILDDDEALKDVEND
jgi:hypothetical protein